MYRFQPSGFCDLKTPWAKCIPKPNIINLGFLKEATVEDWKKNFKKVIDQQIDVSKPRIQRIIGLEGQHVERYHLLIIHIDLYC